jgi:hypothetical protein
VIGNGDDIGFRGEGSWTIAPRESTARDTTLTRPFDRPQRSGLFGHSIDQFTTGFRYASAVHEPNSFRKQAAEVFARAERIGVNWVVIGDGHHR